MPESVRTGDATLYLGDCLDILPTLGPVDAVVTDPPYGVGIAYGEGYNDKRKDYWKWFTDAVEQIRETCPLVAFTHRNEALRHLSGWDWVGVWNKPGSFGSRIGNSFILPHWEPIFFYGIHRRGVHSKYLADVLTENPEPARAGHNGMGREKWTTEGNGRHPCPKPLGLMSKLVETMVEFGETVLDPFMGSGTTGVACARLGRKFIGIEIEPKYFDIACKRISREYEQLKLFPPEEKREVVQLTLEGGE